MVNMMESSLAETMGVRSPVVGALSSEHGNNMANKLELANNMANMTKSNLDNIVGSLWQARQESSGSSRGDQSPRNGDDLSEGELAEPGSPEDNGNEMGQKDRDASEEQDIASDLRLPKGHPFNFPPLAGLPGLPALEALSKQKELLGGNIVLPSSSPQVGSWGGGGLLTEMTQGLLKAPSNLFPSHHPGFPPLRPPSQPTSGSQSNSPSDFGTQQNWSFEEQFKQLYEIDDNPKRKEFLDELFAFMQKRGTPINRLPIMAKQVLDLYELYNLVVARGGLVEVINKKQWQEIIKGLGLPSSITSAAFTLRTQYTKYLYPLECKTVNLSNPSDLQSAIEGNKREGRTSSYGPYGGMGHLPFQNSPLPPSLGAMPPFSMMNTPPRPLHMNGSRPSLHPGGRSPPGLPTGPQDPLAAFEMTRLALLKMYNQREGMGAEGIRPPMPLPNMPLPPDIAGLHQDKALNLHVEMRRREEEMRRKDEEHSLKMEEREKKEAEEREQEREKNIRREMELKRERLVGAAGEDADREEGVSPPPSKRPHPGEEVRTEGRGEVQGLTGLTLPQGVNLPGTNIKITSRGEGEGSSLFVSMELNGLTYQGILFQKGPTSS